jgi:hypothetical protein
VHGAPVVDYLGAGAYQATYALDASSHAIVSLQWQSVVPPGRDPNSVHSEDLLVTCRIDPSDDVQRYGAELPALPGEHFTGLMERVVDAGAVPGLEGPVATALDLRGQLATMFVTGPVALYSPFYVSSSGYGLFRRRHLARRLRHGIVFRRRLAGVRGPADPPAPDSGPDPKTILDRYTQLAGRPLVPPSWAFLPWRWRDEEQEPARVLRQNPGQRPLQLTAR